MDIYVQAVGILNGKSFSVKLPFDSNDEMIDALKGNISNKIARAVEDYLYYESIKLGKDNNED